MRLSIQIGILLAACLMGGTSGCLSLGLGTTTVVEEKPETLARISALETRMSVLEQSRLPVAPEAIPSGPPIPTPASVTFEAQEAQP